MNKLLKYMICCLLSLSAVSCLQEDILSVVNDDIVLSFDGAAMTRAADTSAEEAVSHVDVMIFNSSKAKVHHERIICNGAKSFTLAAKRADFSANAGYYVYLVANASASSSDFAAVSNIQDLNSMVQEDLGLMFANVGDTRHDFLMDAVAYTGNTEPSSPRTVELNDGIMSNSTYLNATLRRAAAKVLVTIHEGQNVSFASADNSTAARYYMRNCPSSTVIIGGSPISNPVLVTPSEPKAQNANFVWGSDKITVAAYGYEYNWKDESIHDKETSIIVNVPMVINGELQENNWYKVPVSQNSCFERNHIYTVDVTINALGATNQDNPQEMDEVRYDVVEWEDVNVNVAQGSGTQYLQLNTNHVNMYNVNVDNSTLTFASSSPIKSITLDEAYFYDYLDKKVNVSSKFPTAYSGINAAWEAGALNGGITINSPFVSKTDYEIEAEIAALGKAPSVPNEPQVPVNPEVSAPNPQELVNKYNEGVSNNRRITYTGEGANVKFSATGSSSTGRQNAERAQAEYDAAYAKYQAWNGLSSEEKQAAISRYNDEVTTYDSRYQAYQSALIAYNNYNQQVEAIRSASGNNTHSNAIRYMSFTVTNQTNQTAVFTVAQHPTIYITNEHGQYSYRSDFNWTGLESNSNNQYSGANWTGAAGTYWSYTEGASGSNFFAAKKATYSSNGSSSISYVDWEDGRESTSSFNTFNNPRMYHVHITATSSIYTVARPRLDSDGFTESSPENTKLVSPSFMIASQLGATDISSNNSDLPGGLEQAKRHCEQYVEVASVDGQMVHYDDWRLPTAAEIDIIIQHQDASDAMAVVLSGSRYYCAYNTNSNGQVIYTKESGKNSGKSHVRCVRDAY